MRALLWVGASGEVLDYAARTSHHENCNESVVEYNLQLKLKGVYSHNVTSPQRHMPLPPSYLNLSSLQLVQTQFTST